MASPSSHSYKIDGGLYFGKYFTAHKLLLNWLTQTMTECVATFPIKVPGWVRKSVVAFVSCLAVVHFEIILCTQPGSLLPWPGLAQKNPLRDAQWLCLSLRPRVCSFTLGQAPVPAFVRSPWISDLWRQRLCWALEQQVPEGSWAASPSVTVVSRI